MAIVILKEDCQLTPDVVEEQLRELCLTYLPERDVPYEYTFEKELPLTGVGKVDFVKVQENVKKKIKKR